MAKKLFCVLPSPLHACAATVHVWVCTSYVPFLQKSQNKVRSEFAFNYSGAPKRSFCSFVSCSGALVLLVHENKQSKKSSQRPDTTLGPWGCLVPYLHPREKPLHLTGPGQGLWILMLHSTEMSLVLPSHWTPCAGWSSLTCSWLVSSVLEELADVHGPCHGWSAWFPHSVPSLSWPQALLIHQRLLIVLSFAPQTPPDSARILVSLHSPHRVLSQVLLLIWTSLLKNES